MEMKPERMEDLIVIISLLIAHPVITVPDSAKHYCFVLDGSGSMNTIVDSETLIEKGKDEIENIIYNASDGSKFTLVFASDTTRVIYEKLGNKEKAVELLGKLQPSGMNIDLNNSMKYVQNYFNENGEFVPEEPENLVPYLDVLRDYVRYSGTTGNSLYYMGSYSWLFDIGYMMDNFIVISSAQIKDKQNNIISNPYEWTELIPYCESVKGALEDTIIDAWRDSPVDQNLYNDVLQGSHYGLTISGETIAIDGNNFVSGTCPDFYESDLAFGAASVWTDLLVEWFGE